jgi:hypothetical protein
MRPYQEYLSKLIEEFDEIKFTHIGRDKNWFAPLNIDVKILRLTATQLKKKWMGIRDIMISNSLSNTRSIPGKHLV